MLVETEPGRNKRIRNKERRYTCKNTYDLKRKQIGAKEIFEEIITENFP